MQLNRRNTLIVIAAAAGATTLLQPVLAAGSSAATPNDATSPSATASASATPSTTPTPTPTVTPTVSSTPTPTPTTSPGVIPPTITAAVTSAYPEQNGWYRGQVNITFTCTPGSAPLASDCPAMASLTAVGANQSLTETIEDTDGGTASITVTENIDLGAPTITKVRPRAGKCAASDPVSGMGSCVVKRTRVHGRHGTRVEWTAIATDRAGNVAKAFGAYKV